MANYTDDPVAMELPKDVAECYNFEKQPRSYGGGDREVWTMLCGNFEIFLAYYHTGGIWMGWNAFQVNKVLSPKTWVMQTGEPNAASDHAYVRIVEPEHMLAEIVAALLTEDKHDA